MSKHKHQLTQASVSTIEPSSTPSVTAFSNDHELNGLAWKYIIAHESHLDHPKYTYAYIFWIIIAGIVALYSIAHHLRLSGGAIGALYSKWGMRRHKLRLWPKALGRAWVMPSNSYLLTIGSVGLTLILLATVGTDHIAHDKRPFDFTPSTHTTAPYATAAKRAIGNSYEQLTTYVSWQVTKAVWTQGNRWGFMVFAALPLLVALALKSGPFGIFTIKWLTHLHWDKVGTLHRAGGWIVWGMTTIHVGTWSKQLWTDRAPESGTPMFFAMCTVWRFRWGITAYVAMTVAMFMSLRKVRDRSYELFYWSHCILMFIMMVGALAHHYSIGVWVGIALFLWGGDRLYRFIRYRYINSGAARLADREADAPHYTTSHTARQDRMSLSERGGSHYSTSTGISPEVFPLPAHIPPGMAQVQLLPSKTMRVSIRTTRKMKWHPGQSLLLHLPDLSHFQTHPFTISNNDPNEIVLIIKARKGLTLKLYQHVVAQLEANLKKAKERPGSIRASIVPRAEPVLIRAGVDGPMGSAARVPWLDFSTVLIIVGGSGVTFGLAMADYLCQVMAAPGFRGNTRRVRFVWIVREYAEITWAAGAFCRFKAALPDPDRLQIDIYVTNGEKSPRPARQRTDATPRPSDVEKLAYDFAPPRPQYTDSRVSSSDSLSSGPSSKADEPQRGYYEGVDPETEMSYEETIGMTNFDDEEDVQDPQENEFSLHLQHEGRVRRARSRKAQKQREKRDKRLVSAAPTSPRASQPNSPKIPDSDVFEQLQNDVAPTVQSHGRAMSTSSAESVYDRYDPYNRRSEIAPSPTGSMVFDEDENVRNTIMSLSSRTQSMVQLEDTHDGKAHKCEGCGRHGAEMLWIDEADYAAASILSENARTGRPKLASIVGEELDTAIGSMIVATCGPGPLNTALRNLVSKAIDPAKISRGDSRGHVTMYSEDFEM